MRKLIRTVVLSAAVVSGAALAQPNIRFSVRPSMAPVAPKVQVIANYNGEVFFAEGAYWSREGSNWFRANDDNRWAWYPVPVNHVPMAVRMLPAGRYRNYHVAWNPPRWTAQPQLVAVAPGIDVVQDSDDEVFLNRNTYWTRHDGKWYRAANDNRWNWQLVMAAYVPAELAQLPVGRYRHYRWTPAYHWASAPQMVNVAAGVDVVQDLDDEVFLARGAYWSRRDGVWYRAANDNRWQWTVVGVNFVPPELVQIPPGRYRHYHPAPPAWTPPIRFASRPPLVQVMPGVSVVPDYDSEIFFAQAAYWVRAPQNGAWYRASDDGQWQWQPVDPRYVPQLIAQSQLGRYRRYRPTPPTWTPQVRFDTRPTVVQVAPGVSVIPDFDGEVFFNQNLYWLRADNGQWFWTADDGRWQWQPLANSPLPPELAQLQPGRYRRYHAGPWSPVVRFDNDPELAEIGPGVKVVENYGEEVYLYRGFYFMRHDDQWYRAHDDGSWEWRPVPARRVPSSVRRIKAGQYVNWHPWAPNYRPDGDPDLVRVARGIEVVADSDAEIFFAKGAYWARHDDDWFRADDDGEWDWQRVTARHVPYPVRRLKAGKYLHYRGDVESADWHRDGDHGRDHDRDHDRDRDGR